MPRPARTSSLTRICGAVLSAVTLLASGSGAGAGGGLAGTWAADLSKCKTPQSDPEAPLVLTEKGYDQHEAHCTFKGLKAAGAGEWKGTAACSVEGDAQSFPVDLTVSGDTLTLTEDGNARDLLRCP